ncbi:MAG: efflux RND transporter periplasmic adaptor subunit [Pseudomonadota bacterium]|uniref:efflux RND transporter periplasmic adaptor subunit n=2 Tax=Roseovarius TaxID=74030 RepID=UPI0022A87F45|nr:efflux RND transporter periplasmic adaptor subunit [Roseovarius sp. EGI FJ00037]MCZ0813036.1 efflux RND transporter periplasmic adaptor subunit [Roseovarius sp. EGI FJ00037]
MLHLIDGPAPVSMHPDSRLVEEEANLAPADEESTTEAGSKMSEPQQTRGQLVPATPRARSRPSRRWQVWAVVGALILALTALVLAQNWMIRPPVVPIESVAPAPVTRLLAVNGRIAAENSVEITPTVTGILTGLPVTEGDAVEAGDILAQVDPEAQRTLLRQARAQLESARDAQAEARAEFDRAAALDSIVARSVRDTYAHRLEAATQEVARLSAALDQARIALENHTIRAPVAGHVVTLDVKQGQLVSPSRPLMTLADLGTLLVEADVDEAYATQIATGQPAVLQLAGETQTRAGRVSYVSRRVDIATGGLAVELSFDTPVLAPVGLTVTTNIIVETRAAALTVPRSALTEAEGETGVFLLREGRAIFRPVSVVDWPAARLIVTEGLAEGDRLVTEATGIIPGQAVTTERR